MKGMAASAPHYYFLIKMSGTHTMLTAGLLLGGVSVDFIHRRVLVPARRGPWIPSRLPLVAQYLRAIRTFRRWEGWDDGQLRTYRLEALRRVVRLCQAKVPFYRELFRACGFDARADFSFEEFARLPPLDKRTLRERTDDFLVEGFERRRLHKRSTGGSTGEPVHVFVGPKDRGWRWAATDALYERAGYRPGDRLALLWGTHLEPTGGDTPFARLSNWMLNQKFFNCFRLDDETFARVHAEMTSFRPRFVQGYASALALFARYLEREGVEPRYPTEAIITGAEKLTGEQRRLVEKVFRRPVFETYGSRECGLLASQVEAGGPFVVAAPLVMLEPYGPADEVGARELLVTHLHAQAMPLLRYRIGDRAVFPEAPAGCVYELSEVTGRVLEHLTMPSGRVIHATQFPHMLKEYDIVEYQVTQQADGSIDLTFVPGPAFDAAQKESLAALVGRMIVEVPVRIGETDWIERTVAGKLRPVVSNFAGLTATDLPRGSALAPHGER